MWKTICAQQHHKIADSSSSSSTTVQTKIELQSIIHLDIRHTNKQRQLPANKFEIAVASLGNFGFVSGNSVNVPGNLSKIDIKTYHTMESDTEKHDGYNAYR